MTPPASEDGLPAPARYQAFAVIILGITLSVLDASIVNLALPDISRDLGASASAAVWVVTAYQLAILALLLPLANLGDRIGYRRVYLAGVVVFTIGSLACLFSRNLPMLAAARALEGLGAAGIMSVNSALVRLTFPSSMLGRAIALNSVVVASGSVAGPTIAAAVLSVASWPWLFAINVPLGVLVVFFGRKSLPFNTHSARKGTPLAWADVALNILTFSLIFLGADALALHGRTHESGLPLPAVGVLAAGVVVAVIYVRRQRGRPMPLLPIDLLAIPVFALSMCTSIAAFAAQTVSFVALPFLLLQGHGFSHLQAGLLITAWPAGIVVSAPIAGKLMVRHPSGLLGGVGLVLLAVGLALLALLPAHPTSFDFAWRLALCGAGFGLFQSPNNHTIVTSAPLARAGAASGMLGTARLTGQSLGAVLVGIVFGFAGAQHGPTIALAVGAFMAAAAAVFSALRVRAVKG
ncbi:MFS transporter [Ramlibacter albus]|uniref:MFS transporter n=1 Tax=Ramlibacter albus TaxID=2079448 RepID=A0A923S867_9BURK|nr:MFS transporter [Ramlibacter albus]MBC5767797.1 MFS transporter [Ramlibacter albus]